MKDFKDGTRQSLDDLPKSVTTRTNENISAVQSLIIENPKFGVRCIEMETKINRETMNRLILKNDLLLKKVCPTWIPHELSPQSKELRINNAKNIRSTIAKLRQQACSSLAIEDVSCFFLTVEDRPNEIDYVKQQYLGLSL